jgi:hypothetical protein
VLPSKQRKALSDPSRTVLTRVCERGWEICAADSENEDVAAWLTQSRLAGKRFSTRAAAVRAISACAKDLPLPEQRTIRRVLITEVERDVEVASETGQDYGFSDEILSETDRMHERQSA